MSFYMFFKRTSDILFSLLFIFILSPLFLILLVIVIIDLKSFPIFYQPRAGLNGDEFYILKLKTMTDAKDNDGILLSDDSRLTKVGSMLRNFSLDEIFQLYNVLIGDMSFIGPRPFLFEYMYIYTEDEKRRHKVRPGITGWAQVNGRNNISWKDKFKLDLYYVDNISLYLDVKILLLTLYKIIKKSDINQNSNTTMEKYNGKN